MTSIQALVITSPGPNFQSLITLYSVCLYRKKKLSAEMIEYPTPPPLTYGEVEGSAKVMVSINFLAHLGQKPVSLQSDPTIHSVVWI